MAQNPSTAEHSSSGIDVMHQFDIIALLPIHIGGFDLSFTNSAAMALLAAILVALFVHLPARAGSGVPGRRQFLVEMVYEFITTTIRETAGSEGLRYFPFVFTLFMFILTCNLLGMVPYSFTVTSHIATTATLALMVFVSVTIIGFARQGWGYLRIFAPAGVPLPLLLILVPIEIISYFMRPLSLSVRLFANMFAGHVLLKVFGSFVVSLGFLLGWIPLFGLVTMTAFEFLVAFLQAYVFAILTCIYLNDALHLDH